MEQKEITRQKWQALVKAQQESQLPVREFCQQRNVCKTTFYGWRKQMGFGENKTSGFMQITPVMAIAHPRIHIETPNGYRVEVEQVGLKNIFEMLRVL